MDNVNPVVPDSCIDPVSSEPLTDAVTLVPCGHSFGKATADILISRGDLCPLDRKPIESYVTSYKIRELVEERMNGGMIDTSGPSVEAAAHLNQAREFYNAFSYPEAIDACIKAMSLNPNYPKAQTLLECCLLAQGKEPEATPTNFPQAAVAQHSVPTVPSGLVLKRRLFGSEKSPASELAKKIELLKSRDQGAFDWLIFASYLYPENISSFWLVTLLKEQMELSLAEAISRAHVVLTLLAQFQLIVYHDKSDAFSFSKKLPEDLQTSFYDEVLSFFLEFGEQLKTSPQLASQRGEEWARHMGKILEHPLAASQDPLIKAKSCGLVGFLYQDYLQDDIRAAEAFRLCLDSKRQAYENRPSADLASSLYDLGKALFKLENYAESLKYHQETLEMRLTLYGKKPHVELYESFHAVGFLLNKTNKCLGSIKHHGRALEIARLLPSRSSITYSLNQVAENFYSFGLYEEALETYQELLQELQEDTEEVKEQRAVCLNQIGNCYHYVWPIGEPDFTDKALEAYQRALEIYQNIEGKKINLDKIEVLFNIGCAFYRQRKYAKSLEAFRHGMVMKEAVSTAEEFSKDSLALLRTFFPEENFQNLSRLEHEQKGLILKNFVWNKALHPQIAWAVWRVGLSFWESGGSGYNDAITSLMEVFKMYQVLHNASSHVNIALTFRALGMSYYRLGQYEEALEYLTKAKDMFHSLYGSDPKGWTTNTLACIATTLHNLGRYSKAVEVRKQITTMHQVIHKGQPHEDIAQNFEHQGVTLHMMDKNEESIEMFKRSLDMYRQIYQNQPHIKIAEILKELGDEYQAQGNTTTALNFWKQSLKTARDPAVYGNNLEELATWIDNIAAPLVNKIKNYEEAKNLYLEELTIYQRLYKEPHTETARVLDNIGVCCHKLDDYKNAFTWYHRALSMYCIVYKRNDTQPDIVKLLEKIKLVEGENSCVIS